jgi:hypothetical protein
MPCYGYFQIALVEGGPCESNRHSLLFERLPLLSLLRVVLARRMAILEWHSAVYKSSRFWRTARAR